MKWQICLTWRDNECCSVMIDIVIIVMRPTTQTAILSLWYINDVTESPPDAIRTRSGHDEMNGDVVKWEFEIVIQYRKQINIFSDDWSSVAFRRFGDTRSLWVRCLSISEWWWDWRLAKVILRESWIVESWMTISFCESLRRIRILNVECWMLNLECWICDWEMMNDEWEMRNVEFVIEEWGVMNEKWGMEIYVSTIFCGMSGLQFVVTICKQFVCPIRCGSQGDADGHIGVRCWIGSTFSGRGNLPKSCNA